MRQRVDGAFLCRSDGRSLGNLIPGGNKQAADRLDPASFKTAETNTAGAFSPQSEAAHFPPPTSEWPLAKSPMRLQWNRHPVAPSAISGGAIKTGSR
jgi:hypothetical protein